MTFEQSLARLEEIVRALETSEMPLDAALALFEEGIEHLRGATGELSAADAVVKKLIARANGVLETTDFRV